MEKEYTKGYNKGYSKRPIWQWIAIYLVFAAVAYGLIYYGYVAVKNYRNNLSGNTTTTQSQPLKY